MNDSNLKIKDQFLLLEIALQIKLENHVSYYLEIMNQASSEVLFADKSTSKTPPRIINLFHKNPRHIIKSYQGKAKIKNIYISASKILCKHTLAKKGNACVRSQINSIASVTSIMQKPLASLIRLTHIFL